jgi:hypothetical protein
MGVALAYFTTFSWPVRLLSTPMKKGKKVQPKRPAPNGYIAKLEHMVDRSNARKRDSHNSPPIRAEFDTFFDMIDSRLTQLLTKSSAIDIRLEELEFKSKSGSRTRKSISPESRVEKASARKISTPRDDLPSLREAISVLTAQITAVRNHQLTLSSQVAELHRAVLSDEL